MLRGIIMFSKMCRGKDCKNPIWVPWVDPLASHGKYYAVDQRLWGKCEGKVENWSLSLSALKIVQERFIS